MMKQLLKKQASFQKFTAKSSVDVSLMILDSIKVAVDPNDWDFHMTESLECQMTTLNFNFLFGVWQWLCCIQIL